MSPDDIDRAKVAALTAVMNAGSAGIRGADLGSHLKGFDVKATYGGIRAFLMAEVPEVRQVGRSGLDPIFAIDSGEPRPPGEADPELWRVWISPGAPHALLVDPATASVRTGAPEAAKDGELAVRPPDVQAHRDIARRFLAELGSSIPQEQVTALEAALNSESRDWWRMWRFALGGGTLVNRWSDFRSQHFMALLREALRAAGVSVESEASITAAVAATRGLIPAGKQRAPRVTPEGESHGDADLALLVATLSSMSPDDRARVWVPFGSVVEALRAQGWTPPRDSKA